MAGKIRMTGEQVSALRKLFEAKKKAAKKAGRDEPPVTALQLDDGTVLLAEDKELHREQCHHLLPAAKKAKQGLPPGTSWERSLEIAAEMFPEPVLSPTGSPFTPPMTTPGLKVEDVVKKKEAAKSGKSVAYTDNGRGGEPEVDLDS